MEITLSIVRSNVRCVEFQGTNWYKTSHITRKVAEKSGEINSTLAYRFRQKYPTSMSKVNTNFWWVREEMVVAYYKFVSDPKNIESARNHLGRFGGAPSDLKGHRKRAEEKIEQKAKQPELPFGRSYEQLEADMICFLSDLIEQQSQIDAQKLAFDTQINKLKSVIEAQHGVINHQERLLAKHSEQIGKLAQIVRNNKVKVGSVVSSDNVVALQQNKVEPKRRFFGLLAG